ncbi:hypothetical protein RND81_03G006700 [Saponaria officinalis]|uniref:Uncharacterized protein n=1 Tax=Saponaria officinalis TaxID=3572 RepID=A0AAW1M4C1_SAPOF
MSSFSSTWRQPFQLAMVFNMFIVLPCFRPASARAQNPPKMNVPAVFAFGDSVVDAGNNNYIPITFVKCNFPPYGMNFEGQKATGRFCDGRLPTDFIVEKLGIKKSLPAYLDDSLQDEDLVTGVSFASSGSGYDHMTSSIVLTRSLDDQLNWFKEYRGKLKAIVGAEKADFIVNNSIFFVVAGTCDLANTYFTFPFRRLFQDVDSYTDIMLDGATSFLKNLYDMGARTIAISSVPPLGYVPSQRTLGGGPTRRRPESYNEAAQIFNLKLFSRLQYLRRTLDKSTLIYMDMYNIFLDIILNHTQYGFKNIDRGCCGSGLIEAGPLCNPFSLLCDAKFLFWDSFHPTEAAYELLSNQILINYFPHLSGASTSPNI